MKAGDFMERVLNLTLQALCLAHHERKKIVAVALTPEVSVS